MSFRLLPRSLVSAVRAWFGRRAARRPLRTGTGPYVNRIISDAILFNEVPSPTEHEAERAAFIAGRLGEFGIAEVAVSPDGCVSCALPSPESTEDYLLLLANTDNESYSPLDSLVRLTDRRAMGCGIADNSLGVATLLVLAEYVQKEQIRLGTNLVLLFLPMTSAASLDRFVRERKEAFRAALFVSGLQLGDVETRLLGSCALLASVRTAERPVFPDGASSSAVSVLAAIASGLGSIRWSEDNQTVLNIARLRAGVGLGYFPSEGTMEVEIYSASTSLLQMARDAASATIQKTAKEMGAAVDVEVRATVPAGDIEKSRFLIDALQEVHRQLGIRTRTVSSAPERALLGALDIPAITVGVTTGRKTLNEEFVDLPPLDKGFRQILRLLERLSRPAGERDA